MAWQDRGPIQIPQQGQAGQGAQSNFGADLLPAGGGIAGSLAGAAGGAAIGSIVPGVGTVIGGLIGGILGGAGGSAAGQVGKNVAIGEKDLGKGVAQEALLGGVFSAPPLRLARGLGAAGKVGLGATKGAAGQTAKQAFEQAFTKPGVLSGVGQSLRGSARGVETGVKASGSRITPKEATEINTFLENTVKVKGLTVPKQLDSLGKFISTKNDELSEALKQSNRALTRQEQKAVADTISKKISENVIAATPSQQRIVDDIIVRIGQSKDVKGLDDIRKLVDQSINFGRNSASPDTAAEQVYKLVRSSLTDEVAGRVGAAKPLKAQLSKALQAEELLLNRAGAGTSAISAPISIATIPIPNRAVQGGQSLIGKTAGVIGGGAGTGASILPTTARQVGGRLAFGGAEPQQPTLDQALMTQSNPAEQGFTSSFGLEQPQTQQQQATQDQSPYPRENLVYDIQRDPDNADKYIAYYQSLQDVFAPASSEGSLSQTGITAVAALDTSLQNLDAVEGVLQQYSGSFDPIRGRIASLNPYDRDATAVNQASLIAAQNIGRALEGGKLTDADIARYQAALPNITDTPEAAQAKINSLRALINGQRQNYLSLQNQYGGAGIDQSSLESALMQQGAF